MSPVYIDSYYLISSLIVLTAALVFYSIGVWSEHVRGKLRFWDLIFMLVALLCDAVGAGLMKNAAQQTQHLNETHTIVGVLAILLILGHTIWAMWVMVSRLPSARLLYNRVSIFIWCLWLVPYFFNMYSLVSLHFN